MKEPIISICRESCRIGLFDGFQLVRDFQSYENELEAITEAYRWFGERTQVVPKIVYPVISKMIMR